MTVKWNVEYTDTYGGEANYSWVRRAVIEVPDNAKRSLVMRRAKAAVDITGLRGKVEDMGDRIDFLPYRHATIMFISWHDDAED